jgi:tetratricopeptide (TPR) repeat protein
MTPRVALSILLVSFLAFPARAQQPKPDAPADLRAQARLILDHAIATAALMDEEEEFEQEELLKKIAVALARAGDAPAGLRIVGQINLDNRDDVLLADIAVGAVRTGNTTVISQAVNLAHDKTYVLGEVADEQARAGELESASRNLREAIQLDEQLSTRVHLSLLVSQLAAAWARHNDTSVAIAEFERLPGEYRDSAIAGIAQVRAEEGNANEAHRTLDMIKLQFRRDWVLGRIAEVQGSSGDLQGAIRTTEGIVDRRIKLVTRAKLAALQAVREGSGEAANMFLNELESSFPKDKASKDSLMRVLAVEQVNAGLINEGLRTAAKIQDYILQQEVHGAAVKKHLEAGDLQAAIAQCQEIGHPHTRIDSLLAIAARQAKNGDRQGASESYAQALEAALASQYKEGVPSAIAEIVRAQGESGDLGGALRTLQSIPSEWDYTSSRDEALIAVALAQLRIGSANEALETIEGVGEFDLPEGLRRLSEGHAKLGDAEGALAWIATLESASFKAHALLGVAEGLLERAEQQDSNKPKQ